MVTHSLIEEKKFGETAKFQVSSLMYIGPNKHDYTNIFFEKPIFKI